MESKRRRKSDDEIDIEQSRAFERGEHDTPELRALEKKAFKTQKARVAARRQLAAMGEVVLPTVVRENGEGWVAYLPQLKIRGDGRTRAQAEKTLKRVFEEKVALDPIGALEGIRATGDVRPVVFKVRPTA